ncbi:MAG: MBL fold metallo-hydrolase [Dehalococcoidales bacterium]|nr:MBL fold metallo-hydrolase [Dehalococcoidales bacterium]
MIFKKLEVGPFASNCYIVGSKTTREGIIIDPGDEADVILNTVKDLELKIKYIILTHGHLDHIGALKKVKEKTGAEIALHTNESESFQNQTINKLFGISYPTPPPPDKLLNDGDKIDIGDLHFTVLHTPGHSLGGLCLIEKEIVFSGDTLFNSSIGRTDLPGGNYSQLINSINTKLMTLPDNTIVYPGHGPETTIGAERRSNPFLSI